MTDHPELLSVAKDSAEPSTNADNQNFLKQILSANLDENLTIQDLLSINEQNKNTHLLQQNQNKISSNVPFNLLKYKSS